MKLGVAVLTSIDDALVLQTRNPVLFARLSRADKTSADLTLAYNAWLLGAQLPSWMGAFNPSSVARRRALRRRAHDKGMRRGTRR